MTTRHACIAVALTLVLPGLALAAGGAPTDPAAEAELSPAEKAAEAYNRGLEKRDRAWELEEKAAGTDDEGKREKLLRKAEKKYREAVEAYQTAIEHNPVLYQAHSALGYAYRKLGEYRKSLAAYDRALELNASYTEAIEYRGEAYLGLDRLEDAKEAYMVLFNQDRERARELMRAMKIWIDSHSSEEGEVDEATVEEFASWVAQREEIAQNSGSAVGSTSGWQQ